MLDSLCSMRELLAAAPEELLDEDLFWDAARRIIKTPNQSHPPYSTICGAIAGLLFAAGRIDEAELDELVTGYLIGITDSQKRVGFLRGLLNTCREAAWQNLRLIQSLDKIIAGWDETEFIDALPSLRLALAGLTPRETDRVASRVADLYGKQEIGDLVEYGVTEGQLEMNRRITSIVLESLKTDGLSHWLESE